MSDDPKNKPLHPPVPEGTPSLLQRDVDLDRRKKVPTFDELRANQARSAPVQTAIPLPGASAPKNRPAGPAAIPLPGAAAARPAAVPPPAPVMSPPAPPPARAAPLSPAIPLPGAAPQSARPPAVPLPAARPTELVAPAAPAALKPPSQTLGATLAEPTAIAPAALERTTSIQPGVPTQPAGAQAMQRPANFHMQGTYVPPSGEETRRVAPVVVTPPPATTGTPAVAPRTATQPATPAALTSIGPTLPSRQPPPSPEAFAATLIPGSSANRSAQSLPVITAPSPSKGASMPPNQHLERPGALQGPTVIDRPSPAIQLLQAEAAASLAAAEPEPSTEIHRALNVAPAPAGGLPKDLRTTDPGTPGPFAAATSDVVPRAAEVSTPVIAPAAAKRAGASKQSLPQAGPVELSPAEQQVLESASASTAGEIRARPAPVWARVVAWSIDALVIGGFVFGLMTLAAVVIGVGETFGDKLMSLSKVAVPALVLGVLFAFVYTTLSALLFSGRTLGRRLTGIRLVDSTGQAPRAIRSVVRAGLSVLSFALFFSGFWLALFDRKGQTLHDKLTGTFVVRLMPEA